MVIRKIWLNQISSAWKIRNIIWLSGVRRVGKTTLARQIEGIHHLNCDLPSVKRTLADPEFFLESCSENTLALDEIHRIHDPSNLLKIAADEHPGIKILATGSSTLAATHKFRDSLTDRKRSIHLPPVLWRETQSSFSINDLNLRLLHGGLPGHLLSKENDPAFFEDWIDSFYARDIQELFNVRNRTGFIGLFHLLGLQSGGMLDITSLGKKTGISRPTVMSYLDAMEIAHALYRLPPFFGGGHREIIKQPKAYLFDTGFVSYIRGWETIRPEDAGFLWEHLVLDELRFDFSARPIHYWRDKSGRELDFIIDRGAGNVDVYEAKYRPDAFEPNHIKYFRSLYPSGKNYVVCPFIRQPYQQRLGGITITFTSQLIT